MKNFKYISALLITLSLVFLSISETISQSSNMKDRFFIGPMNFYYLENLRTQNHRDWYSQLSYNAMQNYCGHFDSLPANWGTQKDGGFFEDTNSYAPYIRGVIKQWYDSAQINSLILEREKILRAAYGQRSTYQAEGVGTWAGKFPAYGYASSDFDAGHDTLDNWMGESVTSKLCRAGIDSPGFMVKGLVDNCEQTNNTDTTNSNSSGLHERLFSDLKQSNYNHRWYIKPRMRIDSLYAKANPDTVVVMVYVMDFNGTVFDSTLIKCKYFLDLTNPLNPKYNGRYIENYYNLPNDTILSVSSRILANGKGNLPDTDSKVDYQIKWLGKVDVWLDYVRVDDSWAHYLFTDTYENEISPGNNNPWKFHRRIKDEVTAFKSIPGLAYFWVDECGFNNIPCIAEVNRLVKQYSGDSISITFIADPIAYVGNGGLRYKGSDWSVNWDTVYSELFSQGAITNQVIGQFFPQHWYILYPSNLTLDDSPDNESGAKRYFDKSNYADYYGEIPNTSWKGYMTYLNKMTKLMRFVSDSAKQWGLTFGAIVQINSDEGKLKGEEPGWGLREPTNEEISVNNFLPMCYGAKQIFQFSYTTTNQGSDNNGIYYNRGLTTPNPNFSNKRILNYYGQQKWQFVKELNERMEKIGNILYPQGDTNLHLKYDRTVTVNTYNYTCTGCNFPYSYISDIKSIHRNASNNFEEESSCINCDPTEKRYWEIGFYNNPSNSNDKSKYFLALNKRTYPEISSDGDLRHLKVKFNTSSLQGFNNWVLKDAAKDSVLCVFNKATNDYVSASIFQPGEGKLLKIAPVMQEGGTFVCNEYVSASAGIFDCKDIVTNNGYELEIEKGVTINFTDTAGIEFSHSRFKSGVSGSGNNVMLKGTGSGQWSGLNLSECELVDVEKTTFQDIMYLESPNSQNTAINLNNCANCYIANSTFLLTTPSSGIYALYTEISEEESEEICNIIAYNTFDLDCEYSPTPINVIAVSSSEIPLLLQSNYLENKRKTGGVGVSISNITGGAIKSCEINDFSTGINSMSSALDISGNMIRSELNNSTGIQESAESSLNLGMVNNIITGGDNIFSNTGTEVNNILTDYSFFNINEGYNTFNVYQSSSNCHLRGVFPGSGEYQIDHFTTVFRLMKQTQTKLIRLSGVRHHTLLSLYSNHTVVNCKTEKIS